MGLCFEEGRRLRDLDIVVHRGMGQWDTVLKTVEIEGSGHSSA
jgi:hypothetical protein